MDSTCLVSTVQAGGGGAMVWGMFSSHILRLIIPINRHLNVTAYLIIVADHVHPFMATIYPSSNGCFENYGRLLSLAQLSNKGAQM